MNSLRQALLALFTINLATLFLLIRRGARAAFSYGSHAYHLFSGYGLPWAWDELPWRRDLHVPSLPPEEVFPGVDFTRSPEILHPFPRNLSIMPHEMVVLTLLVRHFQFRKIVELGTAEGRTTVNLAAHSPEDAEVITVNFPPEPPDNMVGYFYWESPYKHKIKQVYCDATQFDWRPHRDSVDLVFIDAGDDYEMRATETAIVFRMVRVGSIVIWHDYGSAEGPTRIMNYLSTRLPVRHIKKTASVYLHIQTPAILSAARAYSDERLGPEPTAQSI